MYVTNCKLQATASSVSLCQEIANRQQIEEAPLPIIVAPRRHGCNLILLSGDQVSNFNRSKARSLCKRENLQLKSIIAQGMPHGVFQEIDKWHRSGLLDQYTVVEIEAHGQMKNGVHTIGFGNDRTGMATVDLIKHIRGAGLPFGEPWFAGTIIVNSCFVGNLREELAQIDGFHILCGGKKFTIADHLSSANRALLPFLSKEKAQDGQGADGDAIFELLKKHVTYTLSLSGANTKPQVSYVKSIADLVSSGMTSKRLREVFKERLRVGKPAQVEAMLASEPGLLDVLNAQPSGFWRAAGCENVNMMRMLLNHDKHHPHWRADREQLLAAAKLDSSLTGKVALQLGTVFGDILKETFLKPDGHKSAPDPAHRLVLQLAFEHLQACFGPEQGLTEDYLTGTLASDVPAQGAAEVDRRLVNMTAKAASSFLELSVEESAAFKSDLLGELRKLCQPRPHTGLETQQES